MSRNGHLPDGWELCSLDEIGEIVGGGTPDSGNPTYWGGDIPWATPTVITNLGSKYIRRTLQTITDDGLKSSSAKLHPAGTVLITSRASIGFAAINTISMATNQGFQSVRCGSKLDNHFLLYVISHCQPELAKLASGSTFLEVSSSNMKRLKVKLPPLPEQRKIAEILGSVDENIEKTQSLIAKLQDLKKATMQELFTKGIGHTKFKDSPVGRIPEEWSILRLEHCVRPDTIITYGIVQAGPHVEDGVPYIRTGDMTNESLSVKGLLRTSNAIAASYLRSEVHTGEIVCAIRATVGRVHEVPAELDGANLTQGTARIAPRSDICNRYLLWYLRSPLAQRQFEMAVKGTTFIEITLGDLRQILVALPKSQHEQQEMAAVLDAQDQTERAKRDYLCRLQDLKTALMQDLLTGRVRVKV